MSTQRPATTRRRRPGGPTDGLATFDGIGETHDQEDRRCDRARFAQPARRRSHVFLHRGLRAGEELLPDLRQDLLGVGGISVDTGRLPWLGEHGWLPAEPSYNLLSLTRPLVEHVVRKRVLALPGVQCRWGSRASGVTRCDVGWPVRTAEGSEVIAQFVVDATGRGTRLRRWLAEIGVTTPEPLAVDAGLGYATQLIEGGPDPRDLPGSSCRSHRSRQPVASLSPSKGGAGW